MQMGLNEMRYLQSLEEGLEPPGQKNAQKENGSIVSLEMPAGSGLFRNEPWSLLWAAIEYNVIIIIQDPLSLPQSKFVNWGAGKTHPRSWHFNGALNNVRFARARVVVLGCWW